jgi:phosphoglycolate phosphatase
MIRLIAFDLDGTLIDSRRDLADSANEMLGLYGAAPLAHDTVIGMVGEGAKVLISRVLAAAEVTAPIDEALARFLAIYDRRLVDHTRPYAGIVETLRALAPDCRLAVLTNKPRKPAIEILQHFELMDLFVDVIGGDGTLPRKPDPANLLALCAKVGTPARDALVVGDSWVDVDTARNAGANACFVTWGFGQPPADGLRDGEWRIDRPEALLEIVASEPVSGAPVNAGSGPLGSAE